MRKSTKWVILGCLTLSMGVSLWIYIIFATPMITLDEAQAQAEAQAEALATATEVEPEPEEEPYDYTIEYIPPEPEEEIPEAFTPSVTETVNEDGSVTIDRTWGVKPDGAVTIDDPDGADSNMASGGGDVTVDENGTYWGEDTATEPEVTTEPAETTAEPTQSTTTTNENNNGTTTPSNPQNGDTYYDENGQKWKYNNVFGWRITDEGGSGQIIVDTDIVPGQGAIIGSWG